MLHSKLMHKKKEKVALAIAKLEQCEQKGSKH
jgi:AhpD family alkylhydroperoxidase